MKTWNSENAQSKVKELCALSEKEREQEAMTIRENLKEWAQNNFEFSERQTQCLRLLPEAYLDETGFLLARAITKNYPIDVIVSDDSTPVAARKRGDSVEVGWSEKEGFKSSYKFTF